MEWLRENLATLLVVAVLVAAVALAIRARIRQKKSGKCSCGCDCSGCMGRKVVVSSAGIDCLGTGVHATRCCAVCGQNNKIAIQLSERKIS